MARHPGIMIPKENPIADVGRCIWCGRARPQVELTTEHVVPYSFGGHAVLLNACCKSCEDVQSAYIGHCAGKWLRGLRLHHGLPSRKRKNRSVPVIISDDPMDTLEVPKDEAPGVVVFPVLRVPGIIVGAQPKIEFPMIGIYVASTDEDSAGRQEALRASGLDKANATTQIPLGPFYQVLAHIAYAQLVGHRGCDPASPLRKVATGEATCLASHLIGGTPPDWVFIPEPEPGRGIHQMALAKCEADGCVFDLIQIRLFNYLRPLPPVYSVVFDGPGVRACSTNMTFDA